MIFIMAAAGQVGGGVVDELVRQGVPASGVIAGVRDPARFRQSTDTAVTTRRADYSDYSSLEKAFQGVETLVLIPTKTPAGPRCAEHANAMAAAKAAGVRRIVFLSIQAAAPSSLFNVAPFILFAECATRQAGPEWLIARMSLYMDPLAEWAPELAKTGRLPYPVKEARIAYVSRYDISRSLAAIALQADLRGEIVQLTGPAALSMPEVAAALSAATGTNIEFTSITDAEYREICRRDNLPGEIIDILSTMYHAADAQEFSAVTGDIERLTGSPPERVARALARLLAVAHKMVG